MPDISLLQNDIELEDRESKIPSIFLTISIIFLILSIGSWIGLYFYMNTLDENLATVTQSIKSLNTQNAENEVGKLNSIKNKLAVLQTLRKGHTNVNNIVSIIAKTVYPSVYYESSDIDFSTNKVILAGVAQNPKSLAQQVSLYSKSESITSYSISNVSLDANGEVRFQATLSLSIKE